MLNKKYLKFEYLLVLAFACWAIYVVISSLLNKPTYQTATSILPLPAEQIQHTAAFLLDEETVIYADEAFWSEAELLQTALEEISGFKPKLNEAAEPGRELTNAIVLQEAASYGGENFGAEAYRLEVFADVVEIQAAKAAGAFYATQTLLQIYSRDPEVLAIPTDYWKDDRVTYGFPCLEIVDGPTYPWRGMLLDCSRHFMEADFVKRYIDLLAKHKMNVLHWHLTEDQGWRLEIDAYPKLSSVAAWRAAYENGADGEFDPGDAGDRYGGFYTKEQVREIVAYAAERHVTVVPEIEMPGHSQAALAAYPELSCTGGPFTVETEWGVFREIYCAGKEGTFEFMQTVFDEVFDLFPADYIHIGGDEVPKFRWEHCSDCQTRMRQEGLENEEELQAWFINRMAAYAGQRGKTLIGWDEVLEGALAENMLVQAWRGDGLEHGSEALERGHGLIMSPTSHAYFDYDLDAIDLEKVYSFNPGAVLEAHPDKSELLLGGECNMWSERAPQYKVDSKVFPRLLAMSEVLWSGTGKRTFAEFQAAVELHYAKLEEWGVDYGPETVPLSFITKIDPSNSAAKVSVEVVPGSAKYEIRQYKQVEPNGIEGAPPPNGTKAQPSEAKTLQPYVGAIPVENNFSLSAQAFLEGKALASPETRNYRAHKALAASVQLTHQPDGSYLGSLEPAASNLTDAAKGTANFRDGNWLGFYHARDFEATVDLGGVQQRSGVTYESSEVTVGFYQYNNSWIFLPEEVLVYGSNDAEADFILLGTKKNDVLPEQRGQFVKDFVVKFSSVQNFRYIRVVAKSIGIVPDWHEAAGSDSWLFVDEIEVR